VSGVKLKGSFFGPFYGDYWVLAHADDYHRWWANPQGALESVSQPDGGEDLIG